MKRILSAVLTFIMLFTLVSLSSCKKEEEVLVIGYTIYEPMNYLDSSGKLVGFDTEFAEAVAEKLGMTTKFQKIEWASKFLELESGEIDVVWNGFTSNSKESDGRARSEIVDFSYAYMENYQAVVIRKADKDVLTNAASLQGKKYSAESSSSGESMAKTLSDEANYITKSTQTATLTELKSLQVDFVVIDLTMAESMLEKNDYSDLMILDIELENEKYAIGFKKGNTELLNKINAAIKELAEDGTLLALAEKYGLEDKIILNY